MESIKSGLVRAGWGQTTILIFIIVVIIKAWQSEHSNSSLSQSSWWRKCWLESSWRWRQRQSIDHQSDVCVHAERVLSEGVTLQAIQNKKMEARWCQSCLMMSAVCYSSHSCSFVRDSQMCRGQMQREQEGQRPWFPSLRESYPLHASIETSAALQHLAVWSQCSSSKSQLEVKKCLSRVNLLSCFLMERWVFPTQIQRDTPRLLTVGEQ